MRVLELGKFYPPHHGGMETALRDVCLGLVERGHEVTALVAASTRTGSVLDEEGVQVHRLPCYANLRSVPLTPTLPARLRGVLRRFDPDVVHLHLPNPWVASVWMTAGDARPLVVTYHSDIVRQRLLSRFWLPWRRRLLQRARRITVTSEALCASSEALRRVQSRCTVVPLGVDVTWFDGVAAEDVDEVRREVGGRFVLFVGRLVYYKGVDVLLAALRETPARLVVVGDGPQRRTWEQAAATLGVAPRVRFLGDVTDVQLRALYHAAAALVLPSTAASEAFGIVQLEAMACAKPVIAARASAGVESVQVDGETGILVPPRDPAALRRALLVLWNDPDACARLGRAGRRRVQQRYEVHRCVEQLATVLLEAVDEGAGRAGETR